MSVSEQRKRVLAVISTQLAANTITESDYIIDDLARKLLKLPALPIGDKPYLGWLTEVDKQPDKPTHVSKVGIELIKRWEGCRTNAYKCPAGVWTIGYGHTATVRPGMTISQAEAEELLKKDLARFELAVAGLLKVPVTQNQFDALVSFTYNVGIGAFGKSTMLVRLNAKHPLAAAKQFRRWTKAGGAELPGLVKRRSDEEALFLS